MGWDQQDPAAGAGGGLRGEPTGADALRDGPAAEGARPGAPEGQRPARGGRRRLVGILGAVVLVLALVLVVPRVLTTEDGPDTAARAFLDALVAGDAAVLRQHLERPGDATDLALRDEILQAAENRVTSYAIEDVERDGEGARVTALLDDGHEQRPLTLTLHAVAGSSFAPVSWQLDRIAVPEMEVSLPFGTEQIIINGVLVTLEEEDVAKVTFHLPTVALQLLPGTYEITLPGAGPLLEAISSEITVPLYLGHSRSTATPVHYELSETGRAVAAGQLEDLLADCARATTARPEDCPFAAPSADDSWPRQPVRGTWALTAMPEVTTSAWQFGLWSVSGSGGAAEFTPAGSESESEQVPFAVEAFTQVLPDNTLRTDLVDPPGSFTVVVCSTPMDVGGTPQYVAVDPDSQLDCEDGR
ncbi:MAG: hypothetical protein L0G94_17910 [Brachybacterium sp.]|uniref:hypothetical protein n=1 Tax=Brachybacterium sp. TaxID=1891286 RepID=UPI00264A30E0|nr:hypothetical protein [Brachybacterium sp.]MDN5688534.1 hypothetical protein [Brachybacterium sp.]